MALLGLSIDEVNLMANQDIWSKTVRESVLLPAYPLAMWLASSWWRLNWEPLPPTRVRPDVHWRMAHEPGAANQGFVWPQIIFASDGEVMQVWATPTNDTNQSVRYLNGLAAPVSVTLANFARGCQDFIAATLNRLEAVDCKDTPLWNLWQIIKDEGADPEAVKYRRIEAEMGFDPDECPKQLMNEALQLDQEIGAATLSELAPVYGKLSAQEPISSIKTIAESPGLVGRPNAPPYPSITAVRGGVPWQHAVAAAREVRHTLGNPQGMISDAILCDLLGLRESDVHQFAPIKRTHAAIAVPEDTDQFKFIPRKAHPVAKRFELARLFGDYLITNQTNGQWLASTDLRTWRQKYQRAFAAEFLCPIEQLQDFLKGDYSEPVIEEAAEYFQVSYITVDFLLVNNNLIQHSSDTGLPYQLGV